jgi:hypothetical protein
MLPHAMRPTLGRDDRSYDTTIDTMSEEALLRGLQGLLPEEPTFNGQTTPEERHEGPPDRVVTFAVGYVYHAYLVE